MSRLAITVGNVLVDVLPDARGFNEKLAAQLRDLTSKVKLDVDVTAAQQKIALVTQASSKKITVDFDDAGAKAKIKELQSSLTDKNLAIRVTTDEARAKLAELTAKISATKAEISVSEDDTEAKARLAALIAEKRQVQAKLELDTAPAKAQAAETQAEISRLKAQLKVDLDKATAQAELEALTRPDSKTINVKADTGAADAKLAALGSSSSGASGGMVTLMQAAIGLSPALVPIGAAALGVAAALGTMAAAGAAGAGVLAIALGGVTKAVGLLGQQQQAQTAAATAAGASAAANAQAIVAAQRGIQSAEMSLSDARRAAATSAITSSQQVASAQYALIQADQQEQTALAALQSAREAATRQLQSMANAAVDARLAEQQAVLDLETATANYNRTMSSGTATQQQREQAALDLAKAQQHLTESHQAAANAQVDNNKAQKLGVDGAPQVVSAAQSVVSAQHNQEQAAQNLANAQRNAAQQQIQSSEAIVRAQQGVASAMDAMASAQRQAAGQTSASLAAVNAQIAALDPATRSFAEYLRGTWGPIWKQVQSASAGGFLPGLQAGMDAMKSSMPGLITFIQDISKRLGDMATAVGQAFASPFWQSFFAFLSRTIGPVLSSLGTTLGYIATGFAGLWQAFEPIIMPITKGIEGLAKKFADFGTQATGSAGFGKFIAFIRETGPVIMQILGNLWEIIKHVVEALAPLAGPMLAGLSALTGILKQIPVPVLTAAAVAFGAIFAGMKLIQGISAVAALGPWGIAVAAVAGAFLLVYTNSKTFRDFIATQVVPTLKEWGQWIMEHVVPALMAIWDWITKKLVPVLAGIFMDAWNGIKDAVGLVTRVIGDHRKELGQLGDALSWLGGFIVKYIVPILGPILKLAFELLGAAISGVIWWISKMVDAWNWLHDVGKSIGHWFANDFVGFFVGAWDKISSGWDNLVSGIAKLWNNLKHYLMDPVAFIVDVVINQGLISAWDWVVAHLNLPGSWHADPMKVPAVPPLMAHGGVLPGYAPGQDTVHAILSPGEGVLVPEAVRALGGALGINAINSQFSTRVPGPGIKGGRPAFDGGGVWGDIIGFIAGATPAGGVVNAAAAGGNSAAQRLQAIEKDPIGAMKSIASQALGGLSGAAPMFRMLTDVVGGLASGVGKSIKDSLLGALGSVFGGSPGAVGSGVERWRGIVDAVLTQLGQSTSLDNGVLALISKESGGNPSAINLTDSNAKAGHPSQGLMQTIPSTFAAYAGPYASRGITDPFANIYAGVNYALQKYGPGMLAAGGRHDANGNYIGYDFGGTLDPGYHMVYNGTGATEIVAPRQTFEQVMSGASGGSGKPAASGGQFTGTLVLDSGEFLGVVHGAIDASDHALANDVHYSRG